MSDYRVSELSGCYSPRERLEMMGVGSLSTPELLSILIGSGVAKNNALEISSKLMSDVGGLRAIQRMDFPTLTSQMHGIGKAKACAIVTAFELGRRLVLETAQENGTTINSTADAAALVQYEMQALEVEELWTVLLDTRNRVMGIGKVYRGSVNNTQVKIADVFRGAIRKACPALIVVHNHPSGDPTPSPDDVAITRAMNQASKLLDIDLLDHMVIGAGRYVSMKERGLGFS